MDDCVITWKENDIINLYQYLTELDIKLVEKKSQNCMELYVEYFSPNTMNRTIIEYFQDINKTSEVASNKHTITNYIVLLSTPMLFIGIIGKKS